MKEIQLTRGYVALVDDADYERVSQFNWYAAPTGNTVYAYHSFPKPGGQIKRSMHRFILGLTNPKICADHIDRNGLNNQRGNLREATNQQNQWNSAKHKDSQSGFKGVHWVASHKRWRVTIKFEGKRVYLGQFKTAAEAGAVAAAFRKKHHGVFARAIQKKGK